MIRLATRDDVAGMHRVRLAVRENRLADPARFGADDYVREIEDAGRGFVVEVDGAIVGFAVGRAGDGTIWALFVDPEHEGRGHGRRLHDAVVAWLFAQELAELRLTTDAGTRAEAFYRARGWRPDGDADGRGLRFVLRRP